MAEWIHIHLYTAYDTQFSVKDTYRLKMKGWEKVFYANECETKSGIAIFVLEKIDLKTVTRGKKALYIVIKKLLQEDVKLVKIYAPRYIKQILTNIKEDTDRSTMPGDDFKPTYVSGEILQTGKSTKPPPSYMFTRSSKVYHC